MSGTKTAKIVLGGGCFWCTEAVFKQLPGVVGVQPGYAGGKTKDPTYEEVCAGTTGHAEVVEVEYNPKNISLEKILEVFFLAHDPTTLNRQGNDVGEQYRSMVLFMSDEQRQIVESFISKLLRAGFYEDPIVTEVKPLNEFYAAEDEHHNYWRKHPKQAYCQLVITPKVEKIRQKFGMGQG